MYTIIVFLLTLTELCAVLFGYVMQSKLVFTAVVMYGSPIYMFTNLLGKNSAFLENNPIYILFATFHVIKYLCFCRSQMIEDGNVLRTIAIILEAVYLGISAYYSI